MNKVNKDTQKEAQYIPVAEVAQMLGISRVAVFKRIKKGQIPAQKIGRSFAVLRSDISEIMGGLHIESEKKIINEVVKKVVQEYGETLKLLGRE